METLPARGQPMILAVAVLFVLQTGQIPVGQDGGFRSITAALEAAAPGDTVRVSAGVYHEHPVIRKAVTLLGEPGAVIDGGGSGVVLRVSAPAVVSGFTIRGSGASQSEEHAGILAERAHGLVIEGNHIEDVLFGIYVKQSERPVIRGNHVEGKDLAIPLRGDGIRLWYSRGGRIESNTVVRSRDIVIWFSDSTEVAGNRVSDSRYGLHYMYSDHNRFHRNEFVGNEVGAFLMYSRDISFRDNVFADARGVTGRGLGFKDTDSVVAEGNLLVGNAIGIYVDNSPTTEGQRNVFRDNVVAFNDIGVKLLPSVRSNEFAGNDFLGNLVPVSVTGGGDALGNQWRGNFWSDYAGFDRDGDGRGDTPFVYERLSDDLLNRHEELKIFNLGLGTSTLNTLSRALPLLKPSPVVIDSLPRLRARAGEDPVGSLGGPAGWAAAGLLAVAAAAAALRLRGSDWRKP